MIVIGEFYSYDQKDRLTQIDQPDASKIVYTYDAMFGKQVQRFSKGKLLYAHSYDSYDEQGRLLKESLISDLGTQEHQYDLSGNKIYIHSDFLH